MNIYMLLVKYLNIYREYTIADCLSEACLQDKKIPITPLFKLDRSLLYTQTTNSSSNVPLIIAFSAFQSEITNQHYAKYQIENLTLLHGTSNFPLLSFFKQDMDKFNVLHVLDEYQLWTLCNLHEYLFAIKKVIYATNPSHIITFGASSGGFSSLLYGTLLSADLAIAFSPQCIAFHDFMTPYRHELNRKYFFSLKSYCYLNRVIENRCDRVQKSIYLSSGNPIDMWHCNLIRNIDSSIRVHEFNAGNSHNLFQSYGKKFFYEKILDDIKYTLNS